jgi:hypothetical protein
MRYLREICLLFSGVILLFGIARADDSTDSDWSSDPAVHIELRHYEKINGIYAFQLYFTDLPASQQPKLKRMGDLVGLKGYVVGPFSQNMFKTSVGNNPPTEVDASTLELYDPKTSHKVVLTLHNMEPSTPPLVQPPPIAPPPQ